MLLKLIRCRNKAYTDNTMPKEKGQKNKQRSTKHYAETKDRATGTPLKPGVNSGGPEG